ncbi:MAG: 3-deoxy-D-manno-octulosonic acid transferase [Gammaproteobacteria bacterium]|nr:MAG: 3-deoxy-D-manno-octulosonic acid transferase [Gammaproteobacteria bacterium]
MLARMFRGIYTALFYLLLPLVLCRLWVKGTKVPGYRSGWMQRFGCFPHVAGNRSIWVHAVSVGEVRAAMPLIDALLLRHGNMPLVLTTTTPTGHEVAKRHYQNRILVGYLPYDVPSMVNRFLSRTRPRMGIIMERELWPNLFTMCKRQNIPLLLANARMSQNSMQKYHLAGPLVRELLSALTVVSVVSEEDRSRFIELGISPDQLLVTGNLKANALRQPDKPEMKSRIRLRLGHIRPRWLAASTHSGEESIVLDAHEKLLHVMSEALLILVPRHPERCHEVQSMCKEKGIESMLFSQGDTVDSTTQVLIVDTLGDLIHFYSLVDVCFVGGSLCPVGGHNVLEPVMDDCAVLFGPHVWNFDDICRALRKKGGGIEVRDSMDLMETVQRLLVDPRERTCMIEQASKVLEDHKQSLPLHLEKIEQMIGRHLTEDEMMSEAG